MSQGNSAAHTPGPWKIDGVYITSDSLSEDDAIAKLLCDGVIDATTKADARLIAAAPNLLLAAKCFVRWVDDVWGSAALSESTLKEYQDAVAAIKSAEGESQ